VITSPCTVSDGGQSKTFRKGDTLEASATLVTALGANARAATTSAAGRSPTRDDTGEPYAVSNGAP
jgi:hypothetical protein